MVHSAVYLKSFLALTDLHAFLLERFPLAFDMFHRLQVAIVARGCGKSIDGDGEMPIDDGEVIEVAGRIKAVEQLTGRSKVPQLEVLHRGIAQIPDEGRLGSSDRCLSAMKSIICDM
jgi:hypothetical protein